MSRRMKSLGEAMRTTLKNMSDDSGALRKAARAAQVRDIWKHLVEPAFLKHTNSVFILTEQGVKKLVVYVDDSIFAAELNARRELIKMQLAGRFGEEVDEFQIRISKGRHKNVHPFVEDIPSFEQGGKKASGPLRQLSSEEKEAIEADAMAIEDPRIRKAFVRAMISDLESNFDESNQKR